MADWIIIVDDDIVNLKSAGQILSKNHMRVTALRSGEALLEYLGSNDFPDLILLDVNMPGMSGFETMKKLRELEEGREEPPVVFLTAADDLETEITGLQLGAMDYIRKPFVPDVLTGRVQRVLRTQERLHWLEKAAMVDRMIGFLNREASEKIMKELCSTENGFLCILDGGRNRTGPRDYEQPAGDDGRLCQRGKRIRKRLGVYGHSAAESGIV